MDGTNAPARQALASAPDASDEAACIAPISGKTISRSESGRVASSSGRIGGESGGASGDRPRATRLTAASRSPSTASRALISPSANPSTTRAGSLRIGGHRQEVGERGCRVPIDVAIGAGLVAPGVSPEGARPDGDDGSGGDRRLLPGRRDDGCPVVSRAQLAQAVIVRRILVDTRLQPGQLATDEIELQVVPRAGAPRGAEIDLTPRWTPPALEQTVRAETEPGHRVQIRHRAGGLELTRGRQSIERGEIRCREVSRQRYRLQRGVDLVGERLDSRVLLAHGLDTMGGSPIRISASA